MFAKKSGGYVFVPYSDREKTEWAVCQEEKKKYKITIVSVVNKRKKRKFVIFMEWIREATSNQQRDRITL